MTEDLSELFFSAASRDLKKALDSATVGTSRPSALFSSLFVDFAAPMFGSIPGSETGPRDAMTSSRVTLSVSCPVSGFKLLLSSAARASDFCDAVTARGIST